MTSLVTTLGIAPGMRGQVSGLPRGLDLDELRRYEGGDDFVVVFLRSAAEVEQIAGKVVNSVHADGLLWFCFPEPRADDEEITHLAVKTDLTPELGWQPLLDLGYRRVEQQLLEAGEGSKEYAWVALRFAR